MGHILGSSIQTRAKLASGFRGSDLVRPCDMSFHSPRTSLAVQGLRLPVSTAGGTGLIPGQGTKIPHAAWPGQRKTKERKSFTLQKSKRWRPMIVHILIYAK